MDPIEALAAQSLKGKTLNFHNWPLYIDVNSKKQHPTLQAFTKATGAKVDYTEDINDNAQYFGKIQGPLSHHQGLQSTDIIVMTDSSGFPARLIELGWVQKLDKKLIPNVKNLQATQQHPQWDKNRQYSLPWQSGMTGIGFDPKKVGRKPMTISRLLEDKTLKGKVTFLTEMSDSIGLVLLDSGEDPGNVTPKTFNAAVARLQKAVNSGQIRQFHRQRLRAAAGQGRHLGVRRLVGRHGPAAGRPPEPEVDPAGQGLDDLDRQHADPQRGQRPGRLDLHELLLPAEDRSRGRGLRQLHLPRRRRGQGAAQDRPGVAKNTLIFPTSAMLKKAHQFDPKAAQNQTFKAAFQKLIGA